MKYLILVFLIAFSSFLLAQEEDVEVIVPTETSVEGEDNEVFTMVEDMPQFPGGEDELINFLKENIKYPKQAKKKKIEGTVYVQFVVNKDGSITDSKVLRTPHKSLSKSALKTVNAMPNWKPGVQRGKKVKVKYILPLNFKL